MADYLCSCREPAQWFLTLRDTRSWHGKEALTPDGVSSYACCDAHLVDATNYLVGFKGDALLRVRKVNRV